MTRLFCFWAGRPSRQPARPGSARRGCGGSARRERAAWHSHFHCVSGLGAMLGSGLTRRGSDCRATLLTPCVLLTRERCPAAGASGRLAGLLVTCDQVVVCGGRVLEKPASPAEACICASASLKREACRLCFLCSHRRTLSLSARAHAHCYAQEVSLSRALPVLTQTHFEPVWRHELSMCTCSRPNAPPKGPIHVCAGCILRRVAVPGSASSSLLAARGVDHFTLHLTKTLINPSYSATAHGSLRLCGMHAGARVPGGLFGWLRRHSGRGGCHRPAHRRLLRRPRHCRGGPYQYQVTVICQPSLVTGSVCQWGCHHALHADDMPHSHSGAL